MPSDRSPSRSQKESKKTSPSKMSSASGSGTSSKTDCPRINTIPPSNNNEVGTQPSTPKSTKVPKTSSKASLSAGPPSPNRLSTNKFTNLIRRVSRNSKARDKQPAAEVEGQHPAHGRLMISSILSVLPACANGEAVRNHLDGGLAVIANSNHMILQLCKYDPASCPQGGRVDTSDSDIDIANKNPEYWMNAGVSMTVGTSLILPSAVPSGAATLYDDGRKQVLMNVFAEGKDAKTGEPTVIKMDVVFDVHDEGGQDALGGLDAILGMNTLVQYRALVDLTRKTVTLTDVNSQDEEQHVEVVAAWTVYDENVQYSQTM